MDSDQPNTRCPPCSVTVEGWVDCSPMYLDLSWSVVHRRWQPCLNVCRVNILVVIIICPILMCGEGGMHVPPQHIPTLNFRSTPIPNSCLTSSPFLLAASNHITLYCIQSHCIALHPITLHCIESRYSSLPAPKLILTSFDELYPLWAMSSRRAGGLNWDMMLVGQVCVISMKLLALHGFLETIKGLSRDWAS